MIPISTYKKTDIQIVEEALSSLEELIPMQNGRKVHEYPADDKIRHNLYIGLSKLGRVVSQMNAQIQSQEAEIIRLKKQLGLIR